MTHDALFELGVKLVQERIQGTRKGSTEAASAHSLRVAARLTRHGYEGDVVLAGLLHDILEDGDTTLMELRELGYSARTLEIVHLSSHDLGLHVRTSFEKDQRWARMVARLEASGHLDAWAVKVCDLIDNLHGSVTLPAERRAVFFDLKAPTYLSLSRPLLGQTALWSELLEAFISPGVDRFRALLKE
jgi:(p)ppGpp synthase/HD superfamily hydrolase